MSKYDDMFRTERTAYDNDNYCAGCGAILSNRTDVRNAGRGKIAHADCMRPSSPTAPKHRNYKIRGF